MEAIDPQVAQLKEQVAKEKEKAKENLKKVMKLKQEKKELEDQLAAGSGGGGGSAAEVSELRAEVERLKSPPYGDANTSELEV